MSNNSPRSNFYDPKKIRIRIWIRADQGQQTGLITAQVRPFIGMWGGEVDLVIRKSGCRLAFCVGVFLVRGCSVGIYPLGADSSLETREGRCESCLNLAATAAV